MAHNINSVTEIYTQSGILLAKGEFVSETEEFITVLLSPSEFIKIFNQSGSLTIVLTSPSRGVLPHVCRMHSNTAVEGSNDMHIQFLIEERKEPIQRRRDFKVKTNLDTELALMRPKKGICAGVIEDISATGILFATADTLEVGQEFIATFTETKTTLDLYGQVVRIHSRGATNRYGCQFMETPPAQQEILRQYVFQTEATRLRTERNS